MATLAHPGHVEARPTARRWQKSIDDERIMRLFAVLFCLFSIRDTMTGALRYFLSLAHVSPLWFVPDVLSLLAFGYFAWIYAIRNRSIFAAGLVVNTVTAAMIGYIFMEETPFALISSIKAFLPFFVGLIFCGRDVTSYRWVRIILFSMMVASIIGLLLAPYVDYPWMGAAFDNFGQTKNVGRVWWIGEQVRYGGFAGDSTMAAFMVIFPYMLLYRHLPKLATFALWPVIAYAVSISTSRSAQVVEVLFVAYYLSVEILFPALKNALIERKIAFWSFAAVLVPFVLIVLLGGAGLDKISPLLYSIQDRIDNSWQLPFKYLSELFPAGLLLGCGLGCFVYPMDYTVLARYQVPVDNFYLSTYLMLGFPFIITMVGMALAPLKSTTKSKLMMMAMLNVYTITVQGYGPSFATVAIGYAFSDMFLKGTDRWRRRRRTPAAAPQTATAAAD